MTKIRIREQVGTDTVRKFDYQMAVAIDYLLSEINSDSIVLIETLEDFAVFRNPGTELEEVEVFQVKTKNAGLYTTSNLYKDDVLGKIVLTDIFYDSKSKLLNVVCNQNLKGANTELLDKFIFEETLSDSDLNKLKANIKNYLDKNNESIDCIDGYVGKLVYIKSQLPFSGTDERFEETLIGKTDRVIADYLKDENHGISPSGIYNALKVLVDKRRKIKIASSEISDIEALEKKGINVSEVKGLIQQAYETISLSKSEILQHAAEIFLPYEYESIKREYPNYVAYRRNLTDKAFEAALEIIKKEYEKSLIAYSSINEVISSVSQSCISLVPYYSPAIIRIIVIVVAFS